MPDRTFAAPLSLSPSSTETTLVRGTENEEGWGVAGRRARVRSCVYHDVCLPSVYAVFVVHQTVSLLCSRDLSLSMLLWHASGRRESRSTRCFSLRFPLLDFVMYARARCVCVCVCMCLCMCVCVCAWVHHPHKTVLECCALVLGAPPSPSFFSCFSSDPSARSLQSSCCRLKCRCTALPPSDAHTDACEVFPQCSVATTRRGVHTCLEIHKKANKRNDRTE